MGDLQIILTLDPIPPLAGESRILCHCTGHKPPLLLGSWLVPTDEESDAAYMAGVTVAVEAHRPQHAGRRLMAQPGGQLSLPDEGSGSFAQLVEYVREALEHNTVLKPGRCLSSGIDGLAHGMLYSILARLGIEQLGAGLGSVRDAAFCGLPTGADDQSPPAGEP